MAEAKPVFNAMQLLLVAQSAGCCRLGAGPLGRVARTAGLRDLAIADEGLPAGEWPGAKPQPRMINRHNNVRRAVAMIVTASRKL